MSKAAKPEKKAAGSPKEAHQEVESLRREVASLKALKTIQQEQMDILLAKLQVMREVTRVASGSVDLDEMLEMFMDVVLQATKTDAGSLLMLDPRTEELTFRVVRGPKAAEVKGFKLKLGEGIAGWVAKTGESVVSTDTARDHRHTNMISNAVKYEAKNIICVPLKGKKRILGVLELINRVDRKPFTHDDLANLEALSVQISIVLENSDLFDLAQVEIQRLSSLIEVSKVVNSTLELRKLLSLVMEAAAKTLQSDASSILLIDERSGDLVFEVATGEKGENMKEIRVPVGEGIAGWVAQNCKPLLVPDVTQDKRFYKQADEKSKFVTKSILAVPLLAHQKLIGVVEVLNKKSGESFAPEDISLLEALAHQSAVAIENAKLYRDLQNSFLSTVSALAAAVDAKDSYTAGHAQRVTEYSVHIAEELGLSAAEVETIRLSGLMHDLGKIGVSEAILSKPGRLSDEEFAQMKRHPGMGAAILSSVPELAHVIPGIHHHHERVDGRGYPMGLKGDDIPLVGRIIGVADSFDAMTSDRVYRKRLTDQEGIEELKRFSGQQFDKPVVEAFLKAYEKGKIKTIPAKG